MRSVVWMPALCGGILAAACTPQAPLPAQPAMTEIIMEDHRFENAGTLPTGRVVFETANRGRVRHEVVVVVLPEDVPPLLEQLRSGERRATSTLMILPPQAPGARTRFALDLEPGRYGLVCFVRTPGGVPHALKGMASEFRVGPAP